MGMPGAESANANAKLEEHEVREIRAAYEGGTPQHELANEYGVSQPAISSLIRGLTYKHV